MWVREKLGKFETWVLEWIWDSGIRVRVCMGLGFRNFGVWQDRVADSVRFGLGWVRVLGIRCR